MEEPESNVQGGVEHGRDDLLLDGGVQKEGWIGVDFEEVWLKGIAHDDIAA